MQETQVRFLIWDDPTCRGATKCMYHKYWASALDPRSRNCWAHGAAATASALQQAKPLRWEAWALQLENRPPHDNWRKVKSLGSNKDPARPKTDKPINLLCFYTLIVNYQKKKLRKYMCLQLNKKRIKNLGIYLTKEAENLHTEERN